MVQSRSLKLSILLLLCLIARMAMAAPVLLNDMRISTDPQKTRIVFDLNAPVNYQISSLTQPDRLVVDLKNTRLIRPLNLRNLAGSTVKSFRTSNDAKGNLRIVFTLAKPVTFKYFSLPPMAKYPYRLVIDLTAASDTALSKPQPTVNKQALAPPTKNSLATKPIKYVPTATLRPLPKSVASHQPIKVPQPVMTQNTVSLPAHTKGRDIIVVIDPGHGGKDPGATGPRGYHEKDVVLAIAKDLQRLINQEPGFHAVLTRNGDYFITLRQRLMIARKYKADMFVAIHADAYKDVNATGASVFALSERGATSEAARWLAEKENYSELIGGGELPDKDNMLRSVLIDLSQNHTISVSLQIGSQVLRSLSKVTQLHHSRVEQAAFVVLKSPDIPSLLIETGFITNPKQEQLLINPQYQERMANAIMLGIKAYFVSHPPRGSLLATQKSVIRYKVARGDTLLKIAQHYKVNMADLRSYNGLAHNQLTTGQILKIPLATKYYNSAYPTIADIQ